MLNGSVDVHQHLWPSQLVAALRARCEPPRLADWTLHLAGEPAFEVDPSDHDVDRRVAIAGAEGLSRALVSLSSPLGVEYLAAAEAKPLLSAYHDGSLALPAPFEVWAAAGLTVIDEPGLREMLGRGCVGLQLPATALADAAGYAHCAPLLRVLEDVGKPLFVHPGPAAPPRGSVPGWWPPLVPYVQQMHAAWFAFRAFGRRGHPRLRVCFAMLAGLAPLHGERLRARGGGDPQVDPAVYVETSSYGARTVDAIVGALGVDGVVAGSDRPYGRYPSPDQGGTAAHAVRIVNPARLLSPEPAR
ncbi:MAG: 6-methylsalicylate decarboxylase [Pseudonocardiales bacterium]|nr:6-methylsalicylate decarboxylase [Pseudonocardiales bacterium]